MSYQLIKIPHFVLKDKVESYLKEILTAAGCEVQIVSSPKGLLEIYFPREVLEKQASRLRILKRVAQGRSAYFDHTVRDIFEDINSDAFFPEFELAYVQYEFLKTLMPSKTDDKLFHLVRTAGYQGTKDSFYQQKDCMLSWMYRFGLIEETSPVHVMTKAKTIWRQQRGRLLTDEQQIRQYFGEGVALYFAWMNSFTTWLVVPGLLSVGVWLSFRLTGQEPTESSLVTPFAVLMMLWAGCFCKAWARRCNELSVMWGTHETGDELEAPLRAGFRGTLQASPVTGLLERQYPQSKRVMAYVQSVLVTAVFLCMSFCFMMCSLNMQGYIHVANTWTHIPRLAVLAQPGGLFSKDAPSAWRSTLQPLLPVLIHVVVVQAFNQGLYRRVALWLTEQENHRTPEDHDSSLIVKRFCFEAFDTYLPLCYLAFWELNLKLARAELQAMFTIAAVRRLAVECVLPFCINMANEIGAKADLQSLKTLYQERPSNIRVLEDSWKPEYEEFDDFLEMVFQFGYVTMFASAFPLATLISVLYNLLEMKSDLFKICFIHRRPRVLRPANLAAWGVLLRIQAWLAVVSNIALAAFASNQLRSFAPGWFECEDEECEDTSQNSTAECPELVWMWRLEHAVVAVLLVVTYCIPDYKQSTRVLLRRQRYAREKSVLVSMQSKKQLVNQMSSIGQRNVPGLSGSFGSKLGDAIAEMPESAEVPSDAKQ